MTYNPDHNLLKQFRKTQHMLSRFFPSPSLVLVSHVCLGVNVFQINIEREGEENLASVSKILTGNVDVGVLGGNCISVVTLFLEERSEIASTVVTFALIRT